MKFTCAFFFILILVSCTNTDRSNNNETTETNEETQPVSIAKKFPELVSFLKLQDSDFSPARFERQEIEGRRDTVQDLPIDTAGIKPYLPFLIYNSDRSMAIDAVSYNYVVKKKKDSLILLEGGPDVEIGLLDFRNNSRKQLFFSGTVASFLEAKWDGPDTVLFAIALEAATDSIRPVIWEYNTKTRTRAVYQYPGAIHASPEKYAVQILNRKHLSEPATSPE